MRRMLLKWSCRICSQILYFACFYTPVVSNGSDICNAFTPLQCGFEIIFNTNIFCHFLQQFCNMRGCREDQATWLWDAMDTFILRSPHAVDYSVSHAIILLRTCAVFFILHPSTRPFLLVFCSVYCIQETSLNRAYCL